MCNLLDGLLLDGVLLGQPCATWGVRLRDVKDVGGLGTAFVCRIHHWVCSARVTSLLLLLLYIISQITLSTLQQKYWFDCNIAASSPRKVTVEEKMCTD